MSTGRRAFVFKASLSRRTCSTAEAQLAQLARLAELYNAALEERREAWRRQGISVTAAMQSRQLPELKQLRPEYAEINSQVLQDCLQRLDRAYQAFFRRVKAGQTPGFPRFRSARRYDSITFKQTGWKLQGRQLTLAGIGRCKLFLSREIEGRIKTVTLRRDACGDWWVSFSCDQVRERNLPASQEAVGIDLGLEAFLTTSAGERVANPRAGRAAAVRVARLQRQVSRRTRGGARRRKAVRILARAHRRIERLRRDHHHKTARGLVSRFGVIAVEALNVKGLSRGMLSRSVHDAGWGQFLQMLTDKAASAGRVMIAVDPTNTSQQCSACGAMPGYRKALSTRWHYCGCGYTAHRDENAARNILARGLEMLRAVEDTSAVHTVGAPPSGSRRVSKIAA